MSHCLLKNSSNTASPILMKFLVYIVYIFTKGFAPLAFKFTIDLNKVQLGVNYLTVSKASGTGRRWSNLDRRLDLQIVQTFRVQ